ncbi:MAG TPA: mechanosensitive ion channel [Xanthomonadaceae bacterium]|nr:mechanosensitive ion channel [Xanthomonadaceae bacterium]
MDSANAESLIARVVAALAEPSTLLQWAIIAAILISVLAVRTPLRGAGEGWRPALRQRLAVPAAVALASLLGATTLGLLDRPRALVELTAALAASLFLIRLLVHALDRVMRPGPMLRAFEHTVSGVVWAAVAIWQIGWMPAVVGFLDEVALTLGEARVSLLDAFKGLLVVAILLFLAAFVARLLERRLMAADQVSINLRVGLVKVTRFLLILVALLVALNAVGIDLTTLTVFSGAVGVGIGFGLQRIASNFIAGFILIMDRSIRQGDVISVGDTFGWVKALHARYVVVCNRDGVEMLIPNENLITSEVVNWSYSDSNVRVKAPVSISYSDDPEAAMAIMVDVGKAHPRVQKHPEPVARLMAFGDNGIELELRVWIDDPQDGINNIRSELFVEIWKRFMEAGITIPYPQRDVHVTTVPDGWGPERA